mmetsp:Transcript_67406/g.112875  ORF Transcript_67406/g.112875 Transcript_67406/m.112875 type:complete len:331 (+) Transcript_67406:3008-4000(+)
MHWLPLGLNLLRQLGDAIIICLFVLIAPLAQQKLTGHHRVGVDPGVSVQVHEDSVPHLLPDRTILDWLVGLGVPRLLDRCASLGVCALLRPRVDPLLVGFCGRLCSLSLCSLAHVVLRLALAAALLLLLLWHVGLLRGLRHVPALGLVVGRVRGCKQLCLALDLLHLLPGVQNVVAQEFHNQVLEGAQAGLGFGPFLLRKVVLAQLVQQLHGQQLRPGPLRSRKAQEQIVPQLQQHPTEIRLVLPLLRCRHLDEQVLHDLPDHNLRAIVRLSARCCRPQLHASIPLRVRRGCSLREGGAGLDHLQQERGVHPDAVLAVLEGVPHARPRLQ